MTFERPSALEGHSSFHDLDLRGRERGSKRSRKRNVSNAHDLVRPFVMSLGIRNRRQSLTR
jgi:hypothetical protein